MKVLPKDISKPPTKRQIVSSALRQEISKWLALVLVFVSVFIFFFKIVFF